MSSLTKLKNKPGFIANCIVELDKEDRGVERSIVRLNTRRIDKSRQDKERFVRRQPVSIFNPHTGQFIVRMPMGGGGLKGLTLNSVALDYDSIESLGVPGTLKDGPISIELIVSKASLFRIYGYYWNHPDIGYKVALRISMISLIVGIAGAIAGVSSLF